MSDLVLAPKRGLDNFLETGSESTRNKEGLNHLLGSDQVWPLWRGAGVRGEAWMARRSQGFLCTRKTGSGKGGGLC